MNYEERYKDQLETEQLKLKSFKVSYFYADNGMEGRVDIFPEKVIEAKTKEMAAYIYYITFFATTTLKEIDYIHSYGGGGYSSISFEDYLRSDTKYWGLSINEI